MFSKLFIVLVLAGRSFVSIPDAIGVYLSGYSYEWDREPACISYTVDEFHEHNGGVCLDFAYYSAYLLNEAGIQPYEITYCYNFGCTEVHAITVFEWDGGWWKYDNWLLMGPYGDLMSTFWPHEGYMIVPDVVRNFCLYY